MTETMATAPDQHPTPLEAREALVTLIRARAPRAEIERAAGSPASNAWRK